MKKLGLILILCVSLFGIAVSINPESLDVTLSEMESDSTLAIRARLAYARGLYHSTKDLTERISEPTQSDKLLLGQCCHVLAQPHAARGYFSSITDLELIPLALLGLAELYCGDIPDIDSCMKYVEIVSKMDYLSRFVELTLPGSNEEQVAEKPTEEVAGAWTLQFGAFEMETLAQQMAIKVRKEGFRVWIVPKANDETTMFYIFGGEFATKGEAAAQADALAREFECRVVEMPE